MKYVFCLLFFFIGLSVNETNAQDAALDTLTTYSRSKRTSMFTEKVFLHVNRTAYLTGETLWFKAYRVDASEHRFIDWSRILYVEVIDKNQAPVLQAKFPIDRIGGSGSLFLPASLSSGNYMLRAYTHWMKNSGAEFFFQQAITILNPFVPLSRSQDSIQSTLGYDVQFLPEGGDLIHGMESVVGVRIVNRKGHGVYCQGIVLSERNDTVARFNTSAFGLSKFQFTPDAHDTYHVNVIDPDKKTYRYPLPATQLEGYSLHVKESERGKISVTVRSSTHKTETGYLLVHTRQSLKVRQKSVLENGIARFEVNKKLLGPGVSVFTFFDERLQARCERSYFKRPDEKMTISVSGNPYLTQTRQPVNVNMSFLKENDTLKSGVFSISVYRLDSLDLPAANISDYLWLTSDLPGTIENPGYYLSQEATQEDIDNLMLTHGWRRFNWETANELQPQFLPEIGGHLVSGRIAERQSGKLVDRVPVYLAFMGNPVNTYVSQSQNGRVLFETEPITGSKSLIAQTFPSVASQYTLEIDDPFANPTIYSVPGFSLTAQQIHAFEQRSIHMQVQSLFYGNTVVKEAKPQYAAFYGKPDETYQLDDYTRFPTLEEVMREYVPGIRVKKRNEEFRLSIIDQVNKSSFSDDPLVLVDGVPVFNFNKLMEIDPLKLKQLDVIKKRWYLNAMAFDGIVSFTSYKGDLAGFRPPEDALLTNYKGLEASREFFSPRYNPETEKGTLPDARRVLFWSSGNLEEVNHIKFFTSDITGEYRMVVQALSETGLSGYYSTTFVVR